MIDVSPYFDQVFERGSNNYFLLHLASNEEFIACLIALEQEMRNLISSSLGQENLMTSLRWWSAQIQESYLGGGSHPICEGLGKFFASDHGRADQLMAYLMSFVSSVSDNHFRRDFASDKDLLDYCLGFGGNLACAIELIEAGDFKSDREAGIANLGALCFLTSIIQDLAVYLDRGVNPIPVERLRKFGVESRHFAQRLNSPQIASLLREEIDFIRNSFKGSIRPKSSLLKFRRSYSIEILKEMLTSNLLNQRVDLGDMHKYLIYLRSLWF